MVDKAFILAGGLATRLAGSRLTSNKPKSLLKVAGKSVLEWNIENLAEHGVKTIVLGVGHLSQKIEEFLREKNFELELIFSKEKKKLGTAGALKLAEGFFSESFFMCNGDEVKEINYSKVLRVHEKNKGIATLALKKVEDVSHYGVVSLEKEKILEFVEKPSAENAPSNLINAGAYILEPEVFDFIPENKEASIEKEVFPKVAGKGKLFGCKVEGKWYAIDTFERYKNALKELGEK